MGLLQGKLGTSLEVIGVNEEANGKYEATEHLNEAVEADLDGRVDLKAHRLIVCTGPDLDFRKAAQPVVRDLIDRRLVQLDADNLGFLVADDFALMEQDCEPSPPLFALRPLIKGSLWETTATPEIRVQARDLATHILSAIAKSPQCLGSAAD
jgi:uncharacterized NAD(P)/FAD-binding protein YdhS